MIVAGAMIASMAPAMSAYAEETEAVVSEAPDYSREECWYQFTVTGTQSQQKKAKKAGVSCRRNTYLLQLTPAHLSL